jgi:glyoxylase-like metal-dependent hydrolase (beta-lactamase superfamily II)
MHREITYRAPCVIWYIQGTEGNIIVDLGPPDPEQCLKNHDLVITRAEEQQPLNAIKSAGLSPDDVRTVILTHLHWDHAQGFHLFNNATFIVQKKEIEYAIAPFPCHRFIFHEKDTGKPQFVDYLDRIKVIDGDYRVEDGVTCIAIPSHTPGFQGVLAETEQGKHFIAGDAVGLFECWESDPRVPSGLFNDLAQYYKSIEKIEKIADVVLPGHDDKVFDKPVYP